MQKTMCELFAGVGGFRLGLERLNTGWKTTWFSQWEPGARTQWAHECYVKHFGDSPDLNGELHTAQDIATVDKATIPDHSLLVGGFPCQDYSVAHTLASAKGIEGKKGVLWWQIRDTIVAKRPPFCLFENVDRLLKSPATQRGRDFGVILACLAGLGYSAEWRVVNAATYGAAQRRRRTFIFAWRNDTQYGKTIQALSLDKIFLTDGFMAKAFPVSSTNQIQSTTIQKDLLAVSDTFAFAFKSAGFMTNNRIYTANVEEIEESPVLLGEVLETGKVCDDFFITGSDRIAKWNYLKGAKKINRTAANGHQYVFSEAPLLSPTPGTDRRGRCSRVNRLSTEALTLLPIRKREKCAFSLR